MPKEQTPRIAAAEKLEECLQREMAYGLGIERAKVVVDEVIAASYPAKEQSAESDHKGEWPEIRFYRKYPNQHPWVERASGRSPGDYRESEIYVPRSRLDAVVEALEQVSAIRESIVAHQSINWSAHIYPLVAILQQAGIESGDLDALKAKYVSNDPRDTGYDKLGRELERRGLRRENNPLLKLSCACGHKRAAHRNVVGDTRCQRKGCDCKQFDRPALPTEQPEETEERVDG